MKKEEVSKYLKIVAVISVVVLVSVLTYLLTLKRELDSCNEELLLVEEVTNNSDADLNDLGEFKDDEITYDCSFTRTYNIVNTLDGYNAEIPFLSYVVIDSFQDNYARTHIIPIKLKESLENGKRYEFTYTLKGTGLINDINDIYDLLQWTTLYIDDSEHTMNKPSVLVTLSINETDKIGMDQKQEPICKTS